MPFFWSFLGEASNKALSTIAERNDPTTERSDVFVNTSPEVKRFSKGNLEGPGPGAQNLRPRETSESKVDLFPILSSSARSDFNTVNPSLPTGKDFMIQSLYKKNDDEKMSILHQNLGGIGKSNPNV